MAHDPDVLRGLAGEIEETIAEIKRGAIPKSVAVTALGLLVLGKKDLILAALRAPQVDGAETSEWRPIGTAPRDGTLILIWRETRWSDDAYTVVRWDDDWWQVHDGKIDHPLHGDEPLWWRPLSALDQHSLTKDEGGGDA